MTITVRKTVCKTCPWRKEFAHQLTIPTIEDMLKKGIISPCHQELEKYSGSTTQGVEIYASKAPQFKVCRGYVEARVSSGVPAKGVLWKHIYSEFNKGKLNPDVVVLEDIL